MVEPSETMIDAAPESLGDSSADPEFDAACAYARRRRLGPLGPSGGA